MTERENGCDMQIECRNGIPAAESKFANGKEVNTYNMVGMKAHVHPRYGRNSTVLPIAFWY